MAKLYKRYKRMAIGGYQDPMEPVQPKGFDYGSNNNMTSAVGSPKPIDTLGSNTNGANTGKSGWKVSGAQAGAAQGAGQALDSLNPALDINYNQALYNNSVYTRDRQASLQSYNQTSAKFENAALGSGNVYAMAAGAIQKGSRMGDQAMVKATTNHYGEDKSKLSPVLQEINPFHDGVGNIISGTKNLKNRDLNVGEKILGFTSFGANRNRNKLAHLEHQRSDVIEDKNRLNSGLNNYQQALGEGFNPNGENKTLYAKGGSIFVDGQSTLDKMQVGGDINKLSEENVEVEGPSHANGGVKFPQQGVELEGGETVNKDFVFSKQLGFAQQHKPIAKAIGKVEKKPDSLIKQNTLSRLKEREELLKTQQEQTKQQLGIPNELEKGTMANGGSLYNKMSRGGNSGRIELTPQERANLDSLKSNPVAYKNAIHEMMGYKPTSAPAGTEAWKQANTNWDNSIKNINAGFRPERVISTPNANNVALNQAVNNNINPIVNTNVKNMDYVDKIQTNNNAFTNTYNNQAGMDKSTAINYKANGGKLYSKIAKGGSVDWGKTINDVTPYADNIGNAIINAKRAKVNIPDQELTKYVNPVNYNYEAQKIESDRQRIAFNKGIDNSTSNNAVANSNKLAALAQTIASKNAIQQEETNANQGERARVQGVNANIESNNNGITLNNKLRKIGAQDDIRRELSQNLTNASNKYQVNQLTGKREALDRDQSNLDLSSQDPHTVGMMMSSNRDIFKRNGWSDSQIDDFIAKSKTLPKEGSTNLNLNKSGKIRSTKSLYANMGPR